VVGEAEQEPLALTDLSALATISADGRWAAIVTDQGAPRPTWIRRQNGGEWRPFLPAKAAMYKGEFVGDEYWAVSDDISGWCRLVAIPIATVDDPATWREMVPARDECKLGAIRLCGSVPLPSDGAYGLFGMGHILLLANMVVAPDGDGCTFAFSSLDRGCGFYRADLATLALDELEAPTHLLTDRVMEHARIEGPHGAVDYRVLRKVSTALDGSAPVIVTGYGGFNIPQIPHYSPMAAAWTELGGIWVHAHLRGGGERDTDFWLGGRMHRKQGTFDDFFTVIEDLQARGIAAPERTGIWGTSNGGLLIGATVTQRPELVRAAVAQVPILDLFQCRKDPASYNAVMIDYGDPNDPADAPVLRAYSPYHNVEAGVAYPALLCDAGADDVMTPPWHSRKMIAAVAQASSSGRKVALRVRQGAGHNVMSRDLFIDRDIEELTFLWDALAED
jgi:prolyl oligopeptidase